MQIIKEPSPWAPLIEGIGKGVQSFITLDKEDVKKDKARKMYISYGASPEVAEGLVNSSDSFQSAWIKQKLQEPGSGSPHPSGDSPGTGGGERASQGP